MKPLLMYVSFALFLILSVSCSENTPAWYQPGNAIKVETQEGIVVEDSSSSLDAANIDTDPSASPLASPSASPSSSPYASPSAMPSPSVTPPHEAQEEDDSDDTYEHQNDNDHEDYGDDDSGAAQKECAKQLGVHVKKVKICDGSHTLHLSPNEPVVIILKGHDVKTFELTGSATMKSVSRVCIKARGRSIGKINVKKLEIAKLFFNGAGNSQVWLETDSKIINRSIIAKGAARFYVKNADGSVDKYRGNGGKK